MSITHEQVKTAIEVVNNISVLASNPSGADICRAIGITLGCLNELLENIPPEEDLEEEPPSE